MTKTMADISYEVAVALGIVTEGVASGGTTTTIVRPGLLTDPPFPDDHFNRGAAWVLETTDGAAPQAEVHTISDFDAASFTVTTAAFSAAVESGDMFAVSTGGRYPLRQIVQQINRVLRTMAAVLTVDTSTITIATDQTEYNLPAAEMDLRRVYIQGNTDDSDDNQWVLIHNWEVQKTATGTVDKLVVPSNLPDGYALKLEYLAPHARLHSGTDKIDERVNYPLLIERSIVGCLKWRLQQFQDKDPSLREQLNYHLNRLQTLEQRHDEFLDVPRRTGRIMRPWSYAGSRGRYGEYLG